MLKNSIISFSSSSNSAEEPIHPLAPHKSNKKHKKPPPQKWHPNGRPKRDTPNATDVVGLFFY